MMICYFSFNVVVWCGQHGFPAWFCSKRWFGGGREAGCSKSYNTRDSIELMQQGKGEVEHHILKAKNLHYYGQLGIIQSYVPKLAIRDIRVCLLPFCPSKGNGGKHLALHIKLSSWNLCILIGVSNPVKFIKNFGYFWNLISCFLFIILYCCFYFLL